MSKHFNIIEHRLYSFVYLNNNYSYYFPPDICNFNTSLFLFVISFISNCFLMGQFVIKLLKNFIKCRNMALNIVFRIVRKFEFCQEYVTAKRGLMLYLYAKTTDGRCRHYSIGGCSAHLLGQNQSIYVCCHDASRPIDESGELLFYHCEDKRRK